MTTWRAEGHVMEVPAALTNWTPPVVAPLPPQTASTTLQWPSHTRTCRPPSLLPRYCMWGIQ
jgi:hypothetical protein